MYKNKKSFEATVIAKSSDKTIKARIFYTRKHVRYHKILKLYTDILVHDPLNKFQVNDKVRVIVTRPISSRKHHCVLYN